MQFDAVDKLRDDKLKIAEPILQGSDDFVVKAKALLELGEALGALQHHVSAGVDKRQLVPLVVGNLTRALEMTGLNNQVIAKVAIGFEKKTRSSLGVAPEWAQAV